MGEQNGERLTASVDQACIAARSAFADMGTKPASFRAELLEAIAAALEGERERIIATCVEETALTAEELAPEFARMTGTLRMFAGIVRDGSWVRAAISRKRDDGATIGPNHDVRSMLVPLGVVAVFGSSNFPLAYGVCGGDTASALAAGCSVVVKEHPAHPRTGRLICEVAAGAISRAGGAEGLLGYVENKVPSDRGPAEQLVQLVGAVGFTGSVSGGLAIETLANKNARKRVPVFAEMGSNNVVIVTAAAATVRPEQIADELCASILQRFGQQCTCPGTIVVDIGDQAERFVELLAERITRSGGRDMLAPWIKESYERRLAEASACRGVRVAARGVAKSGPKGSYACLLEVPKLFDDAGNVFDQPALRDEIFGPAAVVVTVPIDMVGDLGLDGALACSAYCEPADVASPTDWTFGAASHHGLRRAGRIIFNGVPTGVRVAAGMVHGGPFPATNRPESTAVGPMAIERWCRPVCWQNAPEEMLPAELRDGNPLGIKRVEG